jgi:hypothetical protein
MLLIRYGSRKQAILARRVKAASNSHARFGVSRIIRQIAVFARIFIAIAQLDAALACKPPYPILRAHCRATGARPWIFELVNVTA